MRIVAIAALALALAACGGVEPRILEGVVASVHEEVGIDPGAIDAAARHDEHPLVPQPAPQVTVLLDGGGEVTLPGEASKRYRLGERVRVLNAAEGPLLL